MEIFHPNSDHMVEFEMVGLACQHINDRPQRLTKKCSCHHYEWENQIQ